MDDEPVLEHDAADWVELADGEAALLVMVVFARPQTMVMVPMAITHPQTLLTASLGFPRSK